MPNAPTVKTATIVGGGIAGATIALALRKIGISVTLLEQAPKLDEIGAGVNLAPNATRVLKDLGLLPDLLTKGVRPRNYLMRDATSGNILGKIDLGQDFVDRYGAPVVVVHRADLLDMLVEAARGAGALISANSRVTDVQYDGDRAFTTCADGRTYESDIVLGADGLHSTLRGYISTDRPEIEGYVAFRGTVLRGDLDIDINTTDFTYWIAPGCHMTQYCIRDEGGENEKLINHVAVFKSPAFGRGEPTWGTSEELEAAFVNCVDDIRSVLKVIPRDRNWIMADRKPLSTWALGRLLLVGDAAHPILQYMGQGACQAFEDAITLKGLLSGESSNESGHAAPIATWEEVAQEFQEIRVERAGIVRERVRLLGEMLHSHGLMRSLRDEIFMRSETNHYEHTDWLYGAN